MTEWLVSVGDRIKDTEFRCRYDAACRGGASPDAQAPNVLVLSDAVLDKQCGYVDIGKEDGCVQRAGQGAAKTASLNP
jgi:hypothetical protein